MNTYIQRGLAVCKENHLCAACGGNTGLFHYSWRGPDSSSNILRPPNYLLGVDICKNCYHTHGKKMEEVILDNVQKIGGKKDIICDCGAIVARTTHDFWCSTRGEG